MPNRPRAARLSEAEHEQFDHLKRTMGFSSDPDLLRAGFVALATLHRDGFRFQGDLIYRTSPEGKTLTFYKVKDGCLVPDGREAVWTSAPDDEQAKN